MGYAGEMKNVALVLSGVLAGAVAAMFLVPGVRAEGQKPVAVKWQQFCEGASSINEASTMSAARGKQGYELIGFFGGALCFKRPTSDAVKPDAAEPDAVKPNAAKPDAASLPGPRDGI